MPRRAECLAAIRAALEAGANVNAMDWEGQTPLHRAVTLNTDAAAVTAAVETLVAAGADVHCEALDCRSQPLLMATTNSDTKAAAAAVRALLAAGADALSYDSDGNSAVLCALYGYPEAAEALLAAMPADLALGNLSAAGTPVARQLLPWFIAGHLPLSDAQWALIPTHLTGLGRILPATLACSVDQASQLVRRLPPPDAERLRTAALCLGRVQRHGGQSPQLWPLALPPAAVRRILSFIDSA